MLSRLDSILEPYIQDNGIKLTSGQKNRLYILEKELNDGRLNLDTGLDALKKEKLFKDSDYRGIEMELRHNGIK